MILQPIDFIVYAWIAIALLSAVYVAYDQFRNNPESPVMKWGGCPRHVLHGTHRPPALRYVRQGTGPGTHEQFIQPLWKQRVGSTVHCVAGDATGIILAAVATAFLGLPMWIDLILEYISGFLLGLLVFQSLFMRAMMGGTYAQNVKRTFLPEFLSMNSMMSGMALYDVIWPAREPGMT